MLDTDADICRRVWVLCDACGADPSCGPCSQSRICERHWCYLLSTEARWLFVQCKDCHGRWWHDTGFGVGDRPKGIDVPPWPEPAGVDRRFTRALTSSPNPQRTDTTRPD